METEHKPDDGIETPRLYRIKIEGIDYISFFILDPYIYISSLYLYLLDEYHVHPESCMP